MPVEIRRPTKAIDEIVAQNVDVHIEQMSDSGWFMSLTEADGTYWQFWFGADNMRSKVSFRHTEGPHLEQVDAPSDS